MSAGHLTGGNARTYLYGPLIDAPGAGAEAVAKTIHVRLDRDDPSLSLTVVLAKVQEIQSQHPELDVFFDGDEYAICSRPRKAP